MNFKMDVNPFSMLFGKNADSQENIPSLNEASFQQEKDILAERIFLITIQIEEESGDRAAQLPPACVFVGMDDSIQSLCNVLNDCIHTRLSYTDPENFVVDRREDYEASENEKNLAAMHGKLAYLFSCFQRLHEEKEKCENYIKPTVSMWSDILISNCVKVIVYSDAYIELDDLIVSQSEEISPSFNLFLHGIIDMISKDSRHAVLFEKKVRKTFSELAPKVQGATFGDVLLIEYVQVLSVWAIHPFTAKLFINQKISHGRGIIRVTQTLLEVLLKKSGFVTRPNSQDFTFFERVSTAAHNSNEEMALHNAQSEYLENLTHLYKIICKNQESRNYLMQWLGDYIEKNAFLGKMWPHQQINPLTQVLETDEIFFNLANVFLRLSQPFCSNPNNPQNPKLLKINPLYCGFTGISSREKRTQLDIHTANLNKETCFTPTTDNYNFENSTEKINFITEIFFFTHRCLYLSCHGVLEKFYTSNRHLSRMERLYAEVRNMGESSADITNAFERGMKVYLSTKACLTETNFLQLTANFFVTTAQYLSQISQTEDMSSFDQFVNISDNDISKQLSMTPEFIIENLVDFVVFLHRFAKPSLSLFSFAKSDVMLMISIFMGNKNKMANPHLRCTLTDVINALFFFNEDVTANSDDMTRPKEWLERFSHFPQLTKAVIQLCVDMEISEDEQLSYQKFGFRKTLYKVLKVTWSSEKCSQAIIYHAKYAYEHIEDTNHPLFLSFSNLILNDITYLLDEAMSHLSSIKDAEKAQSEGEWDELNDEERKQKQEKMEQDINIARYYNTLSNLTLDTLSYLSANQDIKKLFCHPVLVERVALMMNNFLLKLVGPTMGALRVQDFSRCNFEPKQLVCDICKIYTNMTDMDDFCQAVVKDGRSYDDKLLARAIRALGKINNMELLEKFLKFSEKCKSVGVMEEEEEEMFEDAPEEFYDQLTYTVMLDPVTLPTSKKVVDRATISRHLLGDTRDPFNRQPLTMDQVMPNEEIKLQIQKWKEDWKTRKHR